jgi:hypothetical protein
MEFISILPQELCEKIECMKTMLEKKAHMKTYLQVQLELKIIFFKSKEDIIRYPYINKSKFYILHILDSYIM